MQAPGLSVRGGYPDRALVLGGARFSASGAAIILLTALVVWLLAPGSWQALIYEDQRTDATALTVVSIWTTNVLIGCLPLLAGVFAHRLATGGHRRWAWAVIVLTGISVMRSPLIIGLVGGLDPAWLAVASAWWLLEITALGTCCAAGWQAFRGADAAAAARKLAHALTFAVVVLGFAAGVEVALT